MAEPLPAVSRQSVWLRWVLAVFAAGATAAGLASAVVGPEDIPAGWQGWLLVPLLSLVLLGGGHRFPVAVLLVSVVAVFVYYASGRPPIGLELLVAPALVNAAERGRWRVAAAVVAGVVLLSYASRIAVSGQALHILGVQLITTVVVLVGALGCGLALRAHGAWRAELQRSHRLELEAHQAALEGRLEAERRALARDIHDVLGHTLVVVGQQAAIARATLDSDPARARAALDLVGTTLRSARAEVRDALQLLRTPGGDTLTPTPGLADLPHLVALVQRPGLRIETELPDLPPLGTAVDTTAYRIVQESLTNVHRHSDATAVRIRALVDEDHLVLTVTDDGHPPAPVVPGSGIHGMVERASLVGGRLTVDATADGVTVRAALPIRGWS